MLMFYLKLSYRRMEEWLLASDLACKELELLRVPDPTTLQHTYAKIRKADRICMNETLLNESGMVEEEGVAADSTGCSPGPVSSDYQSRAGKAYHPWTAMLLIWAICVARPGGSPNAGLGFCWPIPVSMARASGMGT
ncbi:MAG: hypothetical protein QXL34_06340 [Thermosphaera sp.]